MKRRLTMKPRPKAYIDSFKRVASVGTGSMRFQIRTDNKGSFLVTREHMISVGFNEQHEAERFALTDAEFEFIDAVKLEENADCPFCNEHISCEHKF